MEFKLAMAEQIIAQYGHWIRVVTRPPYHVVVQEWGTSTWRDVKEYHTISDDYAWSNAREHAMRLAENTANNLRRET